MSKEFNIQDLLPDNYKAIDYRTTGMGDEFLCDGKIRKWQVDEPSVGMHFIVSKKPWEPKEGQHYFCLTVLQKRNFSNKYDINKFDTNNCFKTLKDAEAALDACNDILCDINH